MVTSSEKMQERVVPFTDSKNICDHAAALLALEAVLCSSSLTKCIVLMVTSLEKTQKKVAPLTDSENNFFSSSWMKCIALTATSLEKSQEVCLLPAPLMDSKNVCDGAAAASSFSGATRGWLG